MLNWDIPAFIEKQVASIKDVIDEERAIVAVSGGVDSTVSAVLTHRAIGEKLLCVFIDDNFMRIGEGDQIKNILASKPLQLPVRVVNERQKFMEALEGIRDAEEKRKIFRHTFYETLSKIAKEEECRFLVQGTIKADIDETEGGIKTQHNILKQIGIDPEKKYGFNIIEPIESLYKFQVREVARYLGVPQGIAERQPFPGPGLSIRVVEDITPGKLAELKKITLLVEETLAPYVPSQYFAAIFNGTLKKELKALQRDIADLLGLKYVRIKAGVLEAKATGVINGKRVYGSIIVIDFLDMSDNPIEPGYQNINTIRAFLEDNYPEATRIMFLLGKREREGFIVAIRAVKTSDFLSAEILEVPWDTLRKVSTKILEASHDIAGVYYDVTPKPPATIEFE